MKRLFLAILLLTLSCKDEDTKRIEELLLSGTVPALTDTSDSDGTSGNISTAPSTITQQFMVLIDDHRASLGLTPLTWDEGLSEIVLAHSEAMANGTTAFGHDGFSGRCSEGRSTIGGGNWCGENVAYGQKTATAVYNAWMNSSGHKANIESSRATHTGLAYKQNSNGVFYWTQIFIEKN